jgi:hypothetical protein
VEGSSGLRVNSQTVESGRLAKSCARFVFQNGERSGVESGGRRVGGGLSFLFLFLFPHPFGIVILFYPHRL